MTKNTKAQQETLQGSAQPVDSIQLNQLIVEWVSRDSVLPNKYNPNRMTTDDRILLRQSLLEDGWTQPIVTLPDTTIVDGEQRWTTSGIPLAPEDLQEIIDKMYERAEQGAVLSESIVNRLKTSLERLKPIYDAFESRFLQSWEEAGKPPKKEYREEVFYRTPSAERPCIAAITGGLVPITRVNFTDDAHKMISTIRHNRARGSHQTSRMSEIAQDLIQLGLQFDDLQDRLGMSHEEAERLIDTAKQTEVLLNQTKDIDYSNAWKVQTIHSLPDNDPVFQEEIIRSAAAQEEKKKAELEALAHQQRIQEEVNRRAEAKQAMTGVAVSQIEKAAIKGKVEAELQPQAPNPNPAKTVRRVMFYVTHDEYEVMVDACNGEQHLAMKLVELCKAHLNARSPQS